jgi:hypothetical protein
VIGSPFHSDGVGPRLQKYGRSVEANGDADGMRGRVDAALSIAKGTVKNRGVGRLSVFFCSIDRDVIEADSDLPHF